MSNTSRKFHQTNKLGSFKDLQRLFGPLPILSGEDPQAYEEIGQCVWDALAPNDFIDIIWVNDVVYLLWEGLRQRRLKVKFIDASKAEGVKKLINRLTGEYRADKFWSDWALGEKEPVELVSSILAKAGLNNETIAAETTGIIIDTLEKIERQISQSEARRLITIRDYDQRRELFNQRQERLRQQPKKPAFGSNQNSKKTPQLDLNLKAVAE